jgi:hypothetical protein
LDKDRVVFFDVENQGLFKMQPIQIEDVSPEQLTEYQGEYYSERLMTTYTLITVDGMLHLRLAKQPGSFPLTAKTRDSFSAPPELSGTSLDFQRDSNGAIKGFQLSFPMSRVKNMHFVKK